MVGARWWGWVGVALAVACEPMDWQTPDDPSSPSAATTADPAPPAAREPAGVTDPPALVLSDDEQAALDPRASREHPRAMALLTTEVQGLQSLVATTPSSAPDRSMLLRRLAEDYVELAASAEQAAAHPSFPSAATPDVQAEMDRTLRSIATTARTAAIAMYTALLDTPFAAPYARLDEVRWYRALEYARVGKVADAKRAALDVLALSPDSPWAPRARLLLGVEHARDPGKSALAAAELDKAVRSSDASVARVAKQRVRRDAPALPPVLRAEPTIVPSAPKATACKMDMECDGASVCRGGVCVP